MPDSSHTPRASARLLAEQQFFACPGRDMREPEGYVACYRAGHPCPPAHAYQREDDEVVVTTWRCPCCGENHGSTCVPKSWLADVAPTTDERPQGADA